MSNVEYLKQLGIELSFCKQSLLRELSDVMITIQRLIDLYDLHLISDKDLIEEIDDEVSYRTKLFQTYLKDTMKRI